MAWYVARPARRLPPPQSGLLNRVGEERGRLRTDIKRRGRDRAQASPGAKRAKVHQGAARVEVGGPFRVQLEA